MAAAQAAHGNEEFVRLRQRVEQLEEQLVDLQVTIGTLESLVRKGGGGGAFSRGGGQPSVPRNGYGSGSSDDGRMQTMETQIGALSQQVEQLTRQLSSSGSGPAGAGPAGYTGGQGNGAGNYGLRPGDAPPKVGQAGQGFGDVTVTPGSPVQPQSFNRRQIQGGTEPLVPQKANFDSRPPRVIYEEAYKYLLVQNYGAAQSAFDKFLLQFPNDELSGNAQYWLGESYYVRGRYKEAAGAFLKGYKVYSKSQKAPDSLLKLAMSLKRLGQKDAACDTFSELGIRFPRAPSHIKQRAQSERRRSGC